MAVKLKPVKEQVIVLTGASSGIGLATARLAAQKGAKLVLAARNEDALQQLVEEINENETGAEAIYVVTDVGVEDEVRVLAERAIDHFGGWDTWINDAGVGIFGRLQDGTTDDHRRLFETNFWGVVYGSLQAARFLKERGGAIINVGSTVSDRVVYMQGMYSTSKHAVKGFTDALRMELEADGAPVAVTLIQPSAIDTPFPQHARNYTDKEPTLPAPVYAPHLVAEAILHCAENPTRSVFVGSGGKALSAMEQLAPRLGDKLMETQAFQNMQKTDEAPRQPQGALHNPTFGLHERGEYAGHVRQTSAYTAASLHPVLTSVLVLGAVGAVLAAVRNASPSDDPTRN